MGQRKPGTKKAVLNVTVDEPVAELVRNIAAHNGETISSVVEAALADYLDGERTRLDGIAAIEEYYDEHGWPSPEVEAQAQAEAEQMIREIDEARQRNAERREAKRQKRRKVASASGASASGASASGASASGASASGESASGESASGESAPESGAVA
jgi:hypothetical protein